MRSYNQYCGIAKALDVIGDRWNLLIVRELVLRGASRYTDLHNGLPGIATNLLAERLRDLEREGIVTREDAPPPVATTLFRLTPRGEALKATLLELGRWGAPMLAEPADEDAYRGYWLGSLDLSDQAPDEPPVTIELRTGEEATTVETVDGSVRTRPGPAETPDLTLTGPPQLIVGVLTGRQTLADAHAAGVEYDGDPAALHRVRPEAAEAH